MAVAHVPGFAGGVVLEGAADTQRTDELAECDGYDIGARGALIAGQGLIDYVVTDDLFGVAAPFTRVYGMRALGGSAGFLREIVVGEGNDLAGANAYLLSIFVRELSVSPVLTALKFGAPTENAVVGTPPVPHANGALVTCAVFSGVQKVFYPAAATNVNVFLVNIGAREGIAPRSIGGGAPAGGGLYALVYDPTGATIALFHSSLFDTLGTGTRGELQAGGGPAGTQAVPLFFRGIASYNGYCMGWGYDYNDPPGDGPAKLMFSTTNPLKWGNDNIGAVGTDRKFSNTDSIFVGDIGEMIRAGIAWNNRFYVGTDQKMHFIAGYGRDSFITDGANPIAKAENVVGPHALIEGPDRLLYGVGDQGLWAFDGNTFERHHRRLRDYKSRSTGWFDLIWVDNTRAATYPGKTNADLVWMAVDWDAEQVLVGIPWCDASAGSGYGIDTVVIKFHTRTGGFTRQVYSGVQYTAADFVRRQREYGSAKFFGTATAGVVNVRKYGAAASAAVSGYIATPLPFATLGPYALYGPDGVGVYRKGYLTLSVESYTTGANVNKFTITPYVDDQALAAFALTIDSAAPGAPADGDLWVDTSDTDPNLGNSVAGAIVPAAHDWIVKTRYNGAWKNVPFGGQKGNRMTIPLTWVPTRGTRLKIKIACVDTNGRHQLEAFGFKAAPVKDAQ